MIWNPWRRIRDLERYAEELRANSALLTMRIDDVCSDRDYWKQKAEVLLDNALMRKGETASPIFTPPPAPFTERTMGSVFGPLAVTEIESAKRRPASRGDGHK